MPIYEYQCKRCQHRFERIQKFSDRHIKKCPECGGPLEQLLSPPAVQFKGSGWYVTDYAKQGVKPSTGESSSAGESGTKAESGTKKDEKPKAESKKSEKK
jgi:putative FmdB family regulatory protein